MISLDFDNNIISQLKPFWNNKPIFRMEYRIFARSDTTVLDFLRAISNHVIVPTRNKSINHSEIIQIGLNKTKSF
jgi:hypothetical protein